MKAHTRSSSIALATLAVGAALSSCVYYPHPVPEMPYSPRRSVVATAPAAEQPVHPRVDTPPTSAPPPTQPTSPWAAPATSSAPDAFPTPITNAPKPVATPPAPAPTPISKVSSVITQPVTTAPTPMVAAPAPAPITPAPVAPPKTTLSTAPEKITNDGPIPVATRVEGDPTRVYNPLDPSKTIRIIDKHGNVFPSGKELKVRGTNYHFYVP